MDPRLTLIMPYYNNPTMLALHYRVWSREWERQYADRTKFIIVDDGSVTEPAAAVERPGRLDIEIYRVTEDRPWHQHAARNLGAHVAPREGWMLLTDMDHVLSPGAVCQLFNKLPRLITLRAYMLDRIEATTGRQTINPKNGEPKPHPNSFLMTRETFWEMGGYDEDFCGVYGTDRMFRERLPKPLDVLGVPLTRYSREIIADASTRTLARKEGRPAGAKRDAARRKAEAGRVGEIVTLNFPWEKVC